MLKFFNSHSIYTVLEYFDVTFFIFYWYYRIQPGLPDLEDIGEKTLFFQLKIEFFHLKYIFLDCLYYQINMSNTNIMSILGKKCLVIQIEVSAN